MDDVTKNSGAAKAGLKKGDVIIKIDDKVINTFADLNGYINTKRPNDAVQVLFLRDEKQLTTTVKLSKNNIVQFKFKGMEFENLSPEVKQKYKINSGIQITKIENPRLKQFQELQGAVILKINETPIIDISQVDKLLSGTSEAEGVQMEIITNRGQVMRIII